LPDEGVPSKQMSSVANIRKNTACNAFHLAIGCVGRPHYWRGVYPLRVGKTEGISSRMTYGGVGKVPPVVRCETDDS
jgi:hypothetical protein